MLSIPSSNAANRFVEAAETASVFFDKGNPVREAPCSDMLVASKSFIRTTTCR